jgi:acyl-CoA hydrolase
MCRQTLIGPINIRAKSYSDFEFIFYHITITEFVLQTREKTRNILPEIIFLMKPLYFRWIRQIFFVKLHEMIKFSNGAAVPFRETQLKAGGKNIMAEITKNVSYSKAEQIQFVMPQHGNRAGRLFGGQLMAWIDLIAAVVAFRHSDGESTTASVDYLSFDKPIFVKDLIVLNGRITYVGNSSMEIRIDTFIERPGLLREHTNRAYLTYVAIDEKGQPRRVPRLAPETPEETAEYEEGLKRASVRKERRLKAAF